ncbi:hypothetical protein, partial [Candidatus Magnetobacterium casense]|uniref:hypothetical protein n=1 Tax=Candidatus Magnetobacterium casense TaxID=1455061 RepID=UPI001C48C62E
VSKCLGLDKSALAAFEYEIGKVSWSDREMMIATGLSEELKLYSQRIQYHRRIGVTGPEQSSA